MSYLAQGIISEAHCHAVAKAAKADLDAAAEGFHFPALNSLANLQHGKNLQQAIFNALKKEANLPQLQEVDIPLKGQPTLCASASVMLPHELFAALHENPNGWAKSILPDPDKLEAFWSAFQGHPCMAQHPLHKRKGYKTKCIPLALHGDEVPVTGIGKIWCRSALVLSWNSLMATAGGASLEDTNLYIFGLFEKFILPASEFTQGTMAALWTLLRWSFDCIWQGKWPARDWLGNMCFGIGALAVLNLSPHQSSFFTKWTPFGHQFMFSSQVPPYFSGRSKGWRAACPRMVWLPPAACRRSRLLCEILEHTQMELTFQVLQSVQSYIRRPPQLAGQQTQLRVAECIAHTCLMEKPF